MTVRKLYSKQYLLIKPRRLISSGQFLSAAYLWGSPDYWLCSGFAIFLTIHDLNQLRSRVSEALIILLYTMFPRNLNFTILLKYLFRNKDITIIFEASFLPAGKIKLDEHELMTAADERTRVINFKFVITLVRRLEWCFSLHSFAPSRCSYLILPPL